MGKKKNKCLPFLDVLRPKMAGLLQFSVHLKPTHTIRYLDSSFNHLFHYKEVVALSLFTHVRRVCFLEAVQKKEQRRTRCDLLKNGCSKSFFEKVAGHEACAPWPFPKTHRFTYIQGTSRALTHVLLEWGIKVAHNPFSTLGHCFPGPKDRSPKEKAQVPVYSTPCAARTWGKQSTFLRSWDNTRMTSASSTDRGEPLLSMARSTELLFTTPTLSTSRPTTMSGFSWNCHIQTTPGNVNQSTGVLLSACFNGTSWRIGVTTRPEEKWCPPVTPAEGPEWDVGFFSSL